MKNFFARITDMNTMYQMPRPPVPTLEFARIADFQDIIEEEVKEGHDVRALYLDGHNNSDADVLTAQADWLGDMIIFCTSELERYGLNPQVVLDIIMDSNASKLGADGQPIKDARGKFLKGPRYWKPEPKIKEWIEKCIAQGEQE